MTANQWEKCVTCHFLTEHTNQFPARIHNTFLCKCPGLLECASHGDVLEEGLRLVQNVKDHFLRNIFNQFCVPASELLGSSQEVGALSFQALLGLGLTSLETASRCAADIPTYLNYSVRENLLLKRFTTVAPRLPNDLCSWVRNGSSLKAFQACEVYLFQKT